MANRNAKTDKKVVEKPETDVQPVPGTAGNSNVEKAEKKQPEGSEKELPVQPEQGGGEPKNDEGDTTLDPEGKEGSAEKEGSGTGDPVTGNETDDRETDEEMEATYKEAKEVIGKMVDEAIDESGILDEPKEVTERRNRIAADVFAKNTACKELYFTNDLIPFFHKSDAAKHGAATLKNDTIVTVYRK